MSTSKVTIIDNTEKVLSAFEKQLKNGLWAIGSTAEGYAKAETPVDTGRLRNSITHAEDDRSVYIGTNVEYAPYIELGSSTHKACHMLGNAAQNHSDEYKKILETALKE